MASLDIKTRKLATRTSTVSNTTKVKSVITLKFQKCHKNKNQSLMRLSLTRKSMSWKIRPRSLKSWERIRKNLTRMAANCSLIKLKNKNIRSIWLKPVLSFSTMIRTTLKKILMRSKTKSTHTKENSISLANPLKEQLNIQKLKTCHMLIWLRKSKESLKKCQPKNYQKPRKCNTQTNLTKSRRERSKCQKKLSPPMNRMKEKMTSKVIETLSKSWELWGKLWLTESLTLITKLNRLKMPFKTVIKPLSKFMRSWEPLTTLSYWKRHQSLSNKSTQSGMRLNNWKNNIKLKHLNTKKSKRRSITLNGLKISRPRKLRHGSNKSNRERNNVWEKRKDQRKPTTNQPRKDKRNRDRLKDKISSDLRERKSIETKSKLMLVLSWFNTAKTWILVLARLKISLHLKKKLSLIKLWRRVNGLRWRTLR